MVIILFFTCVYFVLSPLFCHKLFLQLPLRCLCLLCNSLFITTVSMWLGGLIHDGQSPVSLAVHLPSPLLSWRCSLTREAVSKLSSAAFLSIFKQMQQKFIALSGF